MQDIHQDLIATIMQIVFTMVIISFNSENFNVKRNFTLSRFSYEFNLCAASHCAYFLQRVRLWPFFYTRLFIVIHIHGFILIFTNKGEQIWVASGAPVSNNYDKPQLRGQRPACFIFFHNFSNFRLNVECSKLFSWQHLLITGHWCSANQLSPSLQWAQLNLSSIKHCSFKSTPLVYGTIQRLLPIQVVYLEELSFC